MREKDERRKIFLKKRRNKDKRIERGKEEWKEERKAKAVRKGGRVEGGREKQECLGDTLSTPEFEASHW